MALRRPVTFNQYRGNVQTAAAATTCVSTSELETWLKIPAGDETANLTLMIESATSQIEKYLGACLITQSFSVSYDHWPLQDEPWWDGVRQAHINVITYEGRAADIELPRWPLQSVDSITVDGSSITIGDYFIVDTAQRYGRLALKRGATWPALTNAAANGIVIVYTSGFGANASDVPADLRMAVLQMAAYMFEHRGDGCSAENAFMESGAKDLCNMYKVGRL